MKVILFSLSILISFSLAAQNRTVIAKKYRQKESTAKLFMHLLETKQADSAAKMLAPYLRDPERGMTIKALTAGIKETGVYKKTCELSLVGIFPNDSTITFRCRYYPDKGEEKYRVDISFSMTSPDLWITFVEVTNEKELIELEKNDPDTDIPPPAPTPENSPDFDVIIEK